LAEVGSRCSDTPFPDLGISALVLNGEHDHGVVFVEKVDRIGKSVEQAPAHSFSDEGKLKRRRPDPIEKVDELVGEAAT
jgi:hypothetical protein